MPAGSISVNLPWILEKIRKTPELLIEEKKKGSRLQQENLSCGRTEAVPVRDRQGR